RESVDRAVQRIFRRRGGDVTVTVTGQGATFSTGQISTSLDGADGLLVGTSRPPHAYFTTSDDHYHIANAQLQRSRPAAWMASVDAGSGTSAFLALSPPKPNPGARSTGPLGSKLPAQTLLY